MPSTPTSRRFTASGGPSPSSNGHHAGSRKSARNSNAASAKNATGGAVDHEAIRKRLQDLIGGGHVHSLVNVLPHSLEIVIQHELWKRLTRADGTVFESIGDFLTTYFPHGVGCGQDRNSLSYGQLMELCKDFPTVQKVLAANMPKGKAGRKKAGDEIGAVRHQFERHGSNKTPVLQAKLAESHPEVWSEFLAGKLPSVRAAAEKAGLVKNANDPLARLKSNWKKATAAQRRAFLKFIEENGRS